MTAQSKAIPHTSYVDCTALAISVSSSTHVADAAQLGLALNAARNNDWRANGAGARRHCNYAGAEPPVRDAASSACMFTLQVLTSPPNKGDAAVVTVCHSSDFSSVIESWHIATKRILFVAYERSFI